MQKKDERTMALNEIVPEYDSSIFLVKDLFWDRIHRALALAEITDQSRILDAGCGIGYLCSEIRKKNSRCSLTGIDININVDKLAIPNCQFKIGDVTHLDMPDNSYDLVFALDSLEHIEHVEKAVAEIKRVLKPNGVFIASGPTESVFYKCCRFLIKGTFSDKAGPCTGVHYHTIQKVDSAIREGGFVGEKMVNLPNVPLCVLVKVFRYRNTK